MSKPEVNIDKMHKIVTGKSCSYKTHLSGKNVKPCGFTLYAIDKKLNDALLECANIGPDLKSHFVILPKGTVMYHGTIGDEKHPYNQQKNFGWFTSTLSHQGPVQSNRIDMYRTTMNLLCLFIPRLHQRKMVGTDIVKLITTRHRNLQDNCNVVVKTNNGLNKIGLHLAGYVGCDECEIGLLKPVIDRFVKHVKTIQKTKFID